MSNQPNRTYWRGVQPTSPESDPIPVKLQDAGGAAQGVPGNPVYTAPATGVTVVTEDSGKNTNPRKYETDNAFRSQVLQLSDDTPRALITLTTTPARTAGESLFIYKISITNRCGFLSAVSLEQPVGTEIHQRVFVGNDDTVNETFPTPIPVGSTGVFARRHSTVGTTAIVDVQILGLEV